MADLCPICHHVEGSKACDDWHIEEYLNKRERAIREAARRGRPQPRTARGDQ